jgi:glycosyltransferase involved in cell wall biosynthesis
MPYLNVFSSYRNFTTYLQCLPGYDIVYERINIFNNGAAIASKRLKLPYVLFFEADQIMELDYMGKPITGLLRWRAKNVVNYSLQSANCIICVSSPAKDHLINNWNVPADKIVVFPNGVDVKRFKPEPDKISQTRTSLNLGNAPLIIFVGNFFHWHDVTTLLDAFTQVLAEYPDARLLMVGEGEQRQAMMKHSMDRSIAHAVKFMGHVEHADVPLLMSASDIAVVPYPPIKQGLWLSPLKLFEYMASGIAIVASDVGQKPEVIRNGCNGLMTPPGDVLALGSALKKLIDDPALRSRLGRQAREDAVAKHSWDHYTSRLENLYRSILAGGPVTLC